VEADLVTVAARGVWSAAHTSPTEIEEGLRGLIQESHAGDTGSAAARVLNLVAVVDRDRRDEIDKRLAQVGRYHPSRTIICSVEPGRTDLDARATLAGILDQPAGALGLRHERVTIEVGTEHLSHLDAIVDPILITELATVVWSPHGHSEAVDSLMRLATVILLDSAAEPEIAPALARVSELAQRAYVVDLAWLRSTPWRERVAATFDPAACDAYCERKLYIARQVRRAQGKDMERIERLWVITDAGKPRADVLAATEGTRIARNENLSGGFPGNTAEYIYLIDPLGNLMMRFPRDPDPAQVIKDLQRLLKYSRFG